MNKAALVDLAERVGKTFAMTFLALYAPVILSANGLKDLADLAVAEKAAVAGIASVFSLVVGLIGVNVGNKDTAAIVSAKDSDKGPDADLVASETSGVEIIDVDSEDAPVADGPVSHWVGENGPGLDVPEDDSTPDH